MEQAIHQQENSPSTHEAVSLADKRMLEDSERILELAPLKKLPNNERVARILKARALAKKRFDTCSAQVSNAASPSAPLRDLATKWAGKDATSSRAALLNDPTQQDAVLQLIFDTEIQSSEICGAPTGDDALLLQLAQSPKAMEP
jgi:hypothetical protein